MITFKCASDNGMLHLIVLFVLPVVFTILGAFITHVFGRRADKKRLKAEKQDEVYRILNSLVHLLHSLHYIKDSYPDNRDDVELIKDFKELTYDIDVNRIQVDFILFTYLRNYKNFSIFNEKLNEYLSSKKELAEMARNKPKEYVCKREEFHKRFDALFKEISDAIIELMKEIKLDAKKIFFTDWVKYKFTKLLKRYAGKPRSTS